MSDPLFFQRCNPDTVDLHGLYVAEAKFYFEEAVKKVREHGQPLRVIVGRKYTF